MLAVVRSGSWLTWERLRVYSIMIGGFGVIGLMSLWCSGTGLNDRFGKPIGTDFSGVWTAGRMVLAGDTLGLFDAERHVAFQRTLFGPDTNYYSWLYPPFLLAVAVPLALLPYVAALLVWQGTTLALFVHTIRAIAPRHGLVIPLALGFPAVVVTLGHGHNAFLTASLLGLGLLLLDRRPLVAGVCIGLLAYKPQFGIVLPFVLVLGGHWRAIAAATATVVAMVALTTIAFGPEVWPAFLDGTSFTRHVILENGTTGWHKIQSVFAGVRGWGGSIGLAYAIQAIATGIVLAALATLVWLKADRRLTAAATALGVLLATPYVLDYDLTVIGVAIAFCALHAAERGFDPYEKSMLAALWLVPLVTRGVAQHTGLPLGCLVLCTGFAFVVARGLKTAELKSPLRWSVSHG